MFLIVGLGNPGLKYRKTPHNAGFMTADRLAKKLGLRFRKTEEKAYAAKGRIGDEDVIILKPLTYMNLSGDAVGPAAKKYGVPHDRIIVIHDEKDLDVGKVRIRKGGHSIPSHNGLKSVINGIGGNDFIRIRFGVGKQRGEQKLMDHVLHRLSRDEQKEYDAVIENCADACIEIIRNGLEHAQQLYSTKS
ncbi:MAG: aminoacyl-tRNA hydrolase [Clostridia bacterium]|nr:aminoacyl-tRNA hydrolase [Clostridia bacterium]